MYHVQHNKLGVNHSETCEDPSLHAKRIKIMNLTLMGVCVCVMGLGFFKMFGAQEKYLRHLDSVPCFCH